MGQIYGRDWGVGTPRPLAVRVERTPYRGELLDPHTLQPLVAGSVIATAAEGSTNALEPGTLQFIATVAYRTTAPYFRYISHSPGGHAPHWHLCVASPVRTGRVFLSRGRSLRRSLLAELLTVCYPHSGGGTPSSTQWWRSERGGKKCRQKVYR